MARYNGKKNAIGVVWHERMADGTTDIYFDRSGDPNNIKYREKWVKIDHLGNFLEADEVANGFESDPTLFINQFIGDHQDV